MYPKKIKRIHRALSLLIAVYIAAASCSSRDQDHSMDKANGGTKLNISISGILDNKNPSPQTVASNNTNSNFSTFPQEQLIKRNDFDALISIESIPNNTKFEKSAATNSVTPKAPSTPMQKDNQYRILLYDAAGKTLLKNVVAKSGTNPEIQVDAGIRYKWIAISVDDASVPEVTNGKINADDIANKDVLYASGTIDTQHGENYLEIAFHHKAVRFDINIDTRGLFGSINTLNSFKLNSKYDDSWLNKADLDILSGNFTNFSAMDDRKVVSRLMNKDGSTKDLVKTLTIYTVVPEGTKSEKNLEIQPVFTKNLDRNVYYPPVLTKVNTRKYGGEAYLIINTPGEVIPLPGNKYTINIRLIESAINVGGISFARSDLWYDTSSGQTDRYRFRSDQGHLPYDGTAQTQYWNWKASTPTGTPGSGDPCSLVYPQGLWRMPTKTELSSISQLSSYEYKGFGGSQADTYDSVAVINWARNIDKNTPSSEGDWSDYSNRLIFTFDGYRQDNRVMNSRTQVNADKQGSYTANTFMKYWSGDQESNQGVALYNSATVNVKGPRNFTTSYKTPSISNFDKTLGFNIRCVRK